MKKALVLIDIQREYTTEGRPFYIESIAQSLNNAKKMLEKARKENWFIIHVRHLQEGEIFNGNEYSCFVTDFEPQIGEQQVIKSKFSCFSSMEFTQFLEQKEHWEWFVIGYGSTMCCLSTIIDGYHRGYTFTFVHDASCAKKTENFSEEVNHKFATEHIRTFGKVCSVQDISS